MEIKSSPVSVNFSNKIEMVDARPMSFAEMDAYFNMREQKTASLRLLSNYDLLGVFLPIGLSGLIEECNDAGTLLDPLNTEACYEHGYSYLRCTGLFVSIRAAAKFLEHYVAVDPQTLSLGVVRARAELTVEGSKGRVTIFLIIPNTMQMLPMINRTALAKWYQQIVNFIGSLRSMYRHYDGLFADVSQDIDLLAKTIADNGSCDEVERLFGKIQTAVASFNGVQYFDPKENHG